MKTKLIMFIILVACVAGGQSCKSLFGSDYTVLKAAEMATYVEMKYPETMRRQIASNEATRKQFIDEFKNSFAIAQAAEALGLQKSDDFKKRLQFITDQLIATKYAERNPNVIISKAEWEAYYSGHKNEFESYITMITSLAKRTITDDQKEKQRELWSQTSARAQKGRQAGLDKEAGFPILLKFWKADLLTSLYIQSLREKDKLTDDEKKKYLAEHPDADPQKVKEKAQGLLERVKKGENFEKIATEFSQDPGSKGNGGDLGWFGKGKMDPAFEAAAFALQKGQTSNELVKSRFGYHIIRVDDRRMSSAKNPTPPPKMAGGETAKQNPEPSEEIHAHHILIETRESDQFEERLIQDKVRKDLEDATDKYKVEAPADFIVKVAAPQMGGLIGK